MLLLPDQTYEQYQGQQGTLPTPLIALRHLLSNANFYPKIPRCSDQINCNGKSPTAPLANGKSPTNHSGTNGIEKKEHRVSTPESYEQTSEFFNNIPDFNGEPLGPFSIPSAREMSNATADLLKECELFLYKYRIRPDFFCRYRKAME